MTTPTLQPVEASTEDATRLRLGAAAMVAGLSAQLPLGVLHPHREYANDSPAAFHEYAHSTDWLAVHLGQFLGVLLVSLGLVALGSSLARRRGLRGALGQMGAATALVSASVFAVQMAVDGVALKTAVDAWVSAGAAEHDAAFGIAETVRSLEKGLSGIFSVLNGLTVLALGLGLGCRHGVSRWLGWVGVVAGLGLLTGGVLTAGTGFSREASALMLPTTALVTVFVLGAARAMWRWDDLPVQRTRPAR